jgi:hypothetical protein
MRVGVCIPCIGTHIQYLRKCIDCINNQIVKPDIISISISSYNGEYIDYKSDIVTVLQMTKEKRGASENRNIAAKNIYKNVDILTFMDADDFMHPQKIQQIKKHFIETGADCFVHEFLEYPKKNYFEFNDLRFCWPQIQGRFSLYNHITTNDINCNRVIFYDKVSNTHINHTNGHLTCKINVWEKFPWPEEHNYIGEDSEYNYRLFSKGFKYIVSTDKLSLYSK